MSSVTYRIARPADFPRISAMITEGNKRPQTQCIQSDVHHEPEKVRGEIEELFQKSEIVFCISERSGSEMAGLLGCEVDKEIGRGWLRGPFVTGHGGEQWEEVAHHLWKSLSGHLGEVVLFDAFLHQANDRGNRFYAGLGFHRVRLVHVYECSRRQPGSADGCVPLDAAQSGSVGELHDRFFPGVWIKGAGLLPAINHDHQVFVHVSDGAATGYIFVSYDSGLEEGVVEFLGVKEEFRGRGIGEKLLTRASSWFFEHKKARTASLTVHDELANARALYQRAGFQLRYTGVHSRLERGPRS